MAQNDASGGALSAADPAGPAAIEAVGLVLPTSGRIRVLGHPMPQERAHVLGRMNFESPYVDMPMRLTVRQNLTIFGRLYAVKNLAERIRALASDLDLDDFLDRPNGKLSAGQKTRVAL